MDEKILLSRNLADILNLRIPDIQDLLNIHLTPKTFQKADGSPVTELDLAYSALLERTLLERFPTHCFYSEEKFSEWRFPLMAVDPLDGTREYIRGIGEWALSVGIFESDDFKGAGWVYNPVTRKEFSKGVKREFSHTKFRGEVSRSEWEKGLFKNHSSERFEIKPIGSIAYKLGRLAAGEVDFVVSLWPKSIWDIAGGSLLCQEAGLVFTSAGKKVEKVQREYAPPLIWCAPSLLPELSRLFP